MKQVLLSIAFMLVIAACSPQAQATEISSEVEEQATKISTDLTPAQRIAISEVAQNLGLTPDQVKLVSTEVVNWPDNCLGIPMRGITCAQSITPGFRVTLDANGRQVEYRTNQDATVVRPATVALIWSRMGGIAGFCDNLTIYLSGEVQGSNCKNSRTAENRLADLLSAQEIATMSEWITRYGVSNIDASDPLGAADAMSVKLEFMGLGSERLSPDAQQLLLQFVQDINTKLTNR